MMPIAGQITNYFKPKYLIAAGMLIVGLGIWHMTGMSPQASFDFFAWGARVPNSRNAVPVYPDHDCIIRRPTSGQDQRGRLTN
jgi:hypothetical protein